MKRSVMTECACFGIAASVIPASTPPLPALTGDFGEVLAIIDRAKQQTFKAVNRELISLYWEIGKHVCEKVRKQGWGKSIRLVRKP